MTIQEQIDNEVRELGASAIVFNRRRYGRTTFTWPVLVFAGDRPDEEFAGDPWPSINVPKGELLRSLTAYRGRLQGSAETLR